MTQTRLVAFDLDDTLAPSKSTIDPRIGELLIALASRVDVAIISGGTLAQFMAQVVDHLPATPDAVLERFHLLPTCGTQYYRLASAGVRAVYALSLTDDQKSRALGALEAQARRLGLWTTSTWGEILEDRGSQVTFSALGQHAPVSAKAAWDPTGDRKNALRLAVAEQLPDLEVRSGGSTSVDITERGIDKAFGMRKLSQETGIPLHQMLFVGDRLDVGGNDYPVLTLGVPCRSVANWKQTAALLETIIPTFAALERDGSAARVDQIFTASSSTGRSCTDPSSG